MKYKIYSKEKRWSAYDTDTVHCAEIVFNDGSKKTIESFSLNELTEKLNQIEKEIRR